MTGINYLDAFRQSLDSRFSELRAALDALVVSYTGGDSAAMQQRTVDVHRACQSLCAILDEQHRPDWLSKIADAAGVANQNSRNTQNLINTLLKCFNQIAPIQESHSHYDFDALYAKLRDEGGLPELFDKMIEALRDIIKSELVDSRTAISAIEELISVLKANRNGSWVSVRQSVSFALIFKHVALEGLKKIPGVDVFIVAYEKALDEAESKLDELSDELSRQSKVLLQARIPRIDELPEVLGVPRIEHSAKAETPDKA